VGDIARGDAGDARARGLVERHRHGAPGDHHAEGIVAFEHRRGRSLPQHFDLGPGIEQPELDHARVAGDAGAAVGLHAAQVRLDDDFGHGVRIGVRNA